MLPRPRLAHGKAGRICSFDTQLLLATPYQVVDVTDPVQVAEATAWWTELTDRGGEGMVVKPLDFIAKGKKGLIQPAVKCRGREYLRIIYGPDYTSSANLERLRKRGLGAKRSLASASSLWGSKRWSVLCAANRCVEFMSACLGFWG